MSRSALAVRHVPFEDLGLLAPLLAEHGFQEADYLDAPTAAGAWRGAEDADLLIVLGGPIGVADGAAYPFLGEELDVIARRLAADRPTLGICLGAQLMAVAAGGAVAPGAAAEIGYGPLTLTPAGRDSPLRALEGVNVLHWHGDVVSLPVGVGSLARTRDCDVQAFSPSPNTLGLQFHLEARAASIESWLVGHAYELGARGVDLERLRADAATHGPRLEASAVEVFSVWLAGLRIASSPPSMLAREAA